MVDFILVIILIIVLFMVYKQMSCFDELIESIEYPTILIIYDDQYQIAKKYENDTIKCIPKQEIYHFEQSYQYVILCCEDDYYNLLMNYRIHRDMLDVPSLFFNWKTKVIVVIAFILSIVLGVVAAMFAPDVWKGLVGFGTFAVVLLVLVFIIVKVLHIGRE